MKPDPILAKTLLGPVKQGPDNIFGLKYNMNLYRGCQHGCIYCDTRSTCYGIGELSHIRYKQNALTLLDAELSRKRIKGTIGFGSMNDPYMPVEADLHLTRDALALVRRHRFPVHLITKSSLVVRDIDLLSKIGDVYAAVSMTVTCSDDEMSRILEPGAPVSSERFAALKKLSEAGIYCGVTMMPILPFVNDTVENIQKLVALAAQSGAKYILPFMGLTLREGQREYFYRKLDAHFPGLKDKYVQVFGDGYIANSPNHKLLYSELSGLCHDVGIATQMKIYRPPKSVQLSIFDV